LAEAVPPGLALSILADLPTELWPAYADSLVLTIRRLDLGPGAVTEIRRTQGPLLFFIESGTVGVSVNGRMQSQSAGGATLVETGQHYLLRNEIDEPASVLRLALVPPDEETTVGRGEIAQVIDVGDEIATSPGAVESRLLLQADVPAMSGTAHLFLACLSWVDPMADPGEVSHPGPVGFLVLDGELLVGESGTLSAGDCTLFPPRSPRWLRAGDPPPTILMFGAAPDDQPLWLAADVGSGSSSPGDRLVFDCGGQAAPDEPPVAAGLTPGDSTTLARL
jgi:quercetin dioxygenase-like cupin family protein